MEEMKDMKKRLALGLALVMSASMAFSACGQKADTAANEDATEEVVETTEEDADQVAADNCAALPLLPAQIGTFFSHFHGCPCPE